MKAHLKYLSYVLRHKFFVFQAGLQTGAPLWRLLIHDWSKFLPSEWFPYVRHFYGPVANTPEVGREPWASPTKLAFNHAWNLHQKRNRHHWQFWLLTMDEGSTWAMPMPERYAREMVADWMGAGRAITGRWEAAAWYQKNREKIRLHDETRVFVELLLGLNNAPALFLARLPSRAGVGCQEVIEGSTNRHG